MNLVTITTLFPNCNDLKHGVFIKTRLKHLLQDIDDINVKVIAPVPWFPSSHPRFGEYAKYANVPDYEVIDGIDVYHPKYLVLPKVGMYLTPHFMAKAIDKCLRQIMQAQQVDLVDGHYFYPDGVAIEKVCTRLNIPFTCTARGTDINLIPAYPRARKMLQPVFDNAAHMMSVCQALKDEMINLGVADSRVTVLRNGVDLNLFKPSSDSEQIALKADKGINGPLLLSVGWLIERKGHYLIIDALSSIPDAQLYIAGDGPDLSSLKLQAEKCGLSDRVHFLGSLNQTELNQWMQCADALILASSREGWANVLLESMASGTPVIATKVWGTPEVVQNENVGVLVERDAKSIAAGVNRVLAGSYDRQYIRNYASKFDWKSTSFGQKDIFEAILKQ